MKHPVTSVHLVNFSDSDPRVTIDRRSDDLKEGHLNSYRLNSPTRFARMFKIIEKLPGASIGIYGFYPPAYSVLWNRYKAEPKTLYFLT